MPARRRRAAQLTLDGLPVKPQPAAPRVLRQSERDFMKAVIECAHWLGWKHWHDAATNAPRACWHCGRKSTAPRNAAGWPDLVLIRRPRLIVCELKRQGEKATSAQTAWLAEFAACGVETFCWTADDWPTIEKVLR
jgi:hypothetical protein